ncbi:TonB-dependent receptor [Aquimarina sp. ERC-38]|uniref:TonB-dependent receptor n=1 Tax=Aquimarina sp. ERC-38 TaxID=2949996 RepID=UPI0022454386|nr:TonB-dependent receptor [Aquimarina sp. ERC-38]UZO79881.1 TonB-dependent receptor [Aquimarina sp. ERC-38]
MKKNILFIIIILVFQKATSQSESKEQNAKQQHTLSGYITEAGSGENLSAVSIYSEQLLVGTSSNNYGFYSLTLPEGEHTLKVTFIGYGSIEKKLVLTDDIQISFELTQSEESLEEVLIDANRGVHESEVTQMSVVSLKPSEIQDIPVILGERDVIKTLQLLPGIQGGTEGTSGFFVRGGSPDQNLIILDEAPVYNSNHLFGIFSVFNGNAIQSIDTYKGGFPARYGGRLSSVLNIQMKNGNKQKFSGKFDIGLISSSILLEGPLNKGKTSFIASGRRTYADLLSIPFQPDDVLFRYHFTDFNFKVHHVFNEKDKLYWSTYFGQDKFNGRERTDSDDIFKTKLGWGNITSTLRWNHQFSANLFLNTSLIFSNYRFFANIEDKFDDVRFTLDTKSSIDDIGAKMDFDYFPNPNHTVKLGWASTYHTFTPRQTEIRETGVDPISVDQKIKSLESAIYVEDDWRITDRLTLNPGLRVSHFQFESTNYLNAEPRAALSYKLKHDFALKASYARMNQYIHLLSNTTVGLPIDLWVSSTDVVKPQVSQQYALGVAKDFYNAGYSFSFESYYKKTDDIIGYKEGALFIAAEGIENGDEVNWEDNITTGQGWAYGGEFLLRKKTGKLTGWLGYTLSWSERQFDELNRGQKFFDRFDRRHDVSLVSIYKPGPKITLSGAWVFTTGINFTIPDQVTSISRSNFPLSESFNFPTISQGNTTNITTEKNNFRAENYHRLDLSIQFHKKKKKGRSSTKAFSIYNIYGRKNPFFYTIKINGNKETLTRVSLLQFVPSFTYTYNF